MRRVFSVIGLAAVLWVGVAYYLRLWLETRHETPPPPTAYAILLPPMAHNSWVVIERGNPQCAPLPPGQRPAEVLVPQNGYLCTSEGTGPMWDAARFFLLEGDRRKPLRENSDLHSRGRYVFTGKGCALDADVFFFGTLEAFSVQENMLEYMLETRFPGCLR